MTMSKRVLSCVLALAMVMSMFTCLSALFAVPAKAAEGTSQVKSYADCLTTYGAGFFYMGVDFYEVNNGEATLTDHYVEAGQDLQARVYIKTDRYVGDLGIGLMWDKNFFDYTTGTSLDATMNPNYSAAGVANQSTNGRGLTISYSWKLASAWSSAVTASANHFLTVAEDPTLDQDITKTFIDNNLVATPFASDYTVPDGNMVWAMSEDEYVYSLPAKVKTGLADGTTGFTMSAVAFYKEAYQRSPWYVKFAAQGSACSASASIGYNNQNNAATYFHFEDCKHTFTIGSNPNEQGPVAGTSQVKSYADCLTAYGAGFFYMGVDFYEVNNGEATLTDHYVDAGQNLEARVYIKTDRYVGDLGIGLMWDKNFFDFTTGTSLDATMNPNYSAAGVANQSTNGRGLTISYSWKLASAWSSAVTASANHFLTVAEDPTLDQDITKTFIDNNLVATPFASDYTVPDGNMVWAMSEDEYVYSLPAKVKTGLADGTTGFTMSAVAFYKEAYQRSPWYVKFAAQGSACSASASIGYNNQNNAATYFHFEDCKHHFTIGSAPVGGNKTITFQVNGQTYESYSLAVGAAITVPADPTPAEGYTFAGWALSTAPTVVVDLTGATVSDDATYVAVFNEIVKHNAYFYVDGVLSSTVEVAEGAAITAPADPSKTGYTFNGWNPAVGNMGTADMTFNATFAPKSYTVTWMSEGTQFAQNSVNYDGAYTLPTAPTKTGYVFEGWVDASNNAIPATHTIDGAVTYYANFSIGTFDAIFDANGGKFADESTSIAVPTVFGDTPVAPANPSKTGYEFAGWQPTIGPMNTEGITYVAQWDANTITITFMDGDTIIDTVSGDYGTSANAIQAPQKQGYTFNGWKDANDNAVIFPVTLSEDMVVYADYTAGQVTISFYKGTGGLSDYYTGGYQTVGAAMQLPADPTKSGSTFAGWQDINGNPIPATVPTVNTDYYAQWIDAGYTARFWVRENATTGDWQVYHTVVGTAGSSIEAPETPVKEGYNFQKWTKQNQASALSFPQVMPASDTDFYATFQVGRYTLTWMVDGVVYGTPRTVAYGSAITEPAYTAPAGKTFNGWEEHDATMPAHDYTIHGTTSDITYTVTYTVNGEPYETETVSYGLTNTPPVYDAPDGYTFSGWATQAIYADVTLNATLTKNSYTVNYYLYAGDTTPYATYTIPYGDPVSQPADPDEPGKTFIGWSAEPATMPAENLDIYAVFSDQSYTLTVLDRFGNVAETIDNLVYGNIINEEDLTTPAEDGYTFNGWKIGNDFVEFPYTVTGSVTMQQDLTVNTYTIYYYLDGEEAYSEQYAYDAPVTPYTAPEKTGYTFNGWQDTIPGTMPSDDVYIYGTYTVNQYNAVFYDEDGETVLATVPTDYGETPVYPNAAPTKEGFEFAGWSPALAPMGIEGASYVATFSAGLVNVIVEFYVMDLDGDYIHEYDTSVRAEAESAYTYVPAAMYGFTVDEDESVLDIDYVEPDGSSTVSVYYERNQHTFTTVIDGVEDSDTYYYGAELPTVTVPDKEGYTNNGWDITIPATMPDNDLTATAQYQINQYTITFADTGDSVIPAITQDYNTPVTAPADPTKTGYTFDGWDDDIPETMPAENLTITAQWSINQYTISFADTGDTVIPDITDDYGTPVTAPQDPVKEGYTFTGWDDDIPETIPAENITITATWQVNQYNAIFDINGTTTTVPTNFGEIPVAPVVPDNAKEGYTFTGWDADLAPMTTAGATYTAVFEINTYNAIFDANEGKFADDSTEKIVPTVFEEDIDVPADPQRTGYNFAGWSPEVPGSMPASDMRFVAQWSQDLSFVRVQSVERTTENYYESGLALYEIKVMGHPVKLQFVYKDAQSYTWTCDRHDTPVAAADLSSVPGLVSIVAYDANDQVVATGSADTAYEIWTVNAQLVQGDYKVRAKIDTKPDSWETIDTAFDYTVAYDERPAEDPTEYVISVTPAALAVKRGNTVDIVIVTDESVTKLLLERDNGDGTTSKTAFSNASSLAQIENNGDGTKTWTITYRFTYTGTEDYQDQPWEVYYRTATSTEWTDSGLGYTMHVSRYDIVDTTEPTAYDPFTVVSVTPPENAVKAKYAPVTIVVTDDVAKVRLVNNATGKSSTYLVSTDQNACSNNVTVVSDENGLLTISINYRFPTDGEQTWHVECRGNAWSSATEASTFTLTVAAR